MTPSPSVEPKVSQLRCRGCGAVIDLNADSIEARDLGTDPLRQLQRHVRECDGVELAGFGGWGWKCAPLITALCFEAVNSRENWRAYLAEVVEHFLSEPCKK